MFSSVCLQIELGQIVFVAHEYNGSLLNSEEVNHPWITDRELLNLDLQEGDQVFSPCLNAQLLFWKVHLP